MRRSSKFGFTRPRLSATRSKATTWGIAIGCGVAKTVDDACLIEIVRGHLHFDRVSCSDLDEMLTKLSRDVRKHLVPVRELHTEHGAGQNRYDFAFDFYVLIIALSFSHK